MKITKLSKTLGRVINMGNYSTAKLEQSAEITLDDKDNFEKCEAELYKLVATMLANDIKRMKEGRKKDLLQ